MKTLLNNFRKKEKIAKAVFGAGCFWGVEEIFRVLPGVLETTVGYMGGQTYKPTYEEVCTNETGHTEVVMVTYDSEKIDYSDLLTVFWQNHDPTQVDRQGPDVGEQYRSVIFYYDQTQQELAEKTKADLTISGRFEKPIVTAIVPVEVFYPAEEYHQKYLLKRGQNVCH